ncbi:MAG: hypothetical protein AB7I35_01420 [Ramlibacter sp.]
MNDVELTELLATVRFTAELIQSQQGEIAAIRSGLFALLGAVGLSSPAMPDKILANLDTLVQVAETGLANQSRAAFSEYIETMRAIVEATQR